VSVKPRGPWPPRYLTKTTPAERNRGDGPAVAEFIEDVCRITKDCFAGTVGDKIILHDWQRTLLENLFVRRTKDNRRRFRQALIGMPRKNGKSALASGIALYGLLCDVSGAEVYSCAGDREQARIVFGMARRMVELDPTLSDAIRIYRDALEVPDTGSIYRVLSSEAFSKEGLSPTIVVFDEVHVQPNDELWDVMNLGSGARREPLILGITTAGARTDTLGRDSLCYRLYQHGKRVCSNEIADPTFFFSWWEPKKGTEADHHDPKVWAEANPGLGTILDIEDLESTVVRTSESEFRTKRTNVWVTSSESALPFGAWDKCADAKRTVTLDTPVVLFFDGSWSGDSTALVGATIEEQPHIFVVEAWEREGEVEWRVPILEVEERIRQACRQLQVREVSCDPYRWQRSIQTLETERLPMAEWPMSIPRVVPAWQSFYEAIVDKRLTHDGDKRLARHLENTVLKRDGRGARPTKETRGSNRHIDLAICAMGAHNRAVQLGGEPTREFFGAWA